VANGTGAARWIVRQKLGADNHLAIANLAERPGVLSRHSNGSAAFFGQTGIVKDQDPARDRMQVEEPFHAGFIQGEWIPDGVGEQVLQAFQGGSSAHLRDGLARFMRSISRQPSQVALHAVLAAVSAQQGSKWLQERRQFR
jgi:hypothetical protein